MNTYKRLVAVIVIVSMCYSLAVQAVVAQELCPGKKEKIESKKKEIQDKHEELKKLKLQLEGKEAELKVAYLDMAVILDQIALITTAVAAAAALLGAAIEALGGLKAVWSAAVKLFSKLWNVVKAISSKISRLEMKIDGLISKIKKNSGGIFWHWFRLIQLLTPFNLKISSSVILSSMMPKLTAGTSLVVWWMRTKLCRIHITFNRS